MSDSPSISANVHGIDAASPDLRVVEVDFRNDPRWLQFLESHPGALIYHHPGWLSALESEYGRKCIALGCVDRDSSFQGVLPLFATRGLPSIVGRQVGLGQRLASLPRTPIAGPLYNTESAFAALVQAAIDRARACPGVQLQLKMNMPGPEKCLNGLHRTLWRTSYVYQFPCQPPDGFGCERESTPGHELRFGNSRNHLRIKCSVNKASTFGVHVRLAEEVGDLKAWYGLYLHTMRDNVLPARPYRFFDCLWKQLQPLGLMRLWVAEHGAGSSRNMISGLIVLMYGGTAFYAFAGCSREAFRLHPNDVLQYHAMHEAWRAGCRSYDFGEVSEDDRQLAHYKKKWGSTPVRLCRYYYPAPVDSSPDYQRSGLVYAVARAFWRNLPLKATAVMGDWINRYL